jgi:curved DNA-binding protein CbpA
MTERNPFDILGVSPGATDEDVRRAYLALVRKFPPDTAPRRFAEINEANERIKTEKKRLEYELFSKEPGIERPFDALLEQFRGSRKRTPPDYNTMMRFLRECMTRNK